MATQEIRFQPESSNASGIRNKKIIDVDILKIHLQHRTNTVYQLDIPLGA